jgi:Protein of unknown function (DUF3099)
MSQDIAYRQKRYLIMMGFRLVCFVIAVVVFVNGGGWLTAIPAVGAIAIPYFAVVFANGGREPSGRERFRPYEPNLPQRYQPPDEAGDPHGGSNGRQPGTAGSGGTDIPGSAGAPPRSG